MSKQKDNKDEKRPYSWEEEFHPDGIDGRVVDGLIQVWPSAEMLNEIRNIFKGKKEIRKEEDDE